MIMSSNSFDIMDELRMRVANEENYLKNAKEFSADTESALYSKRQIDVDTARLMYTQDHICERPKERVIEQENWPRTSNSLPSGRDKSISKLESGISETRMFIKGMSKSFAGSK